MRRMRRSWRLAPHQARQVAHLLPVSPSRVACRGIEESQPGLDAYCAGLGPYLWSLARREVIWKRRRQRQSCR
eukprot:6212422-Pleurochrysis_carterae.AAC.1